MEVRDDVYAYGIRWEDLGFAVVAGPEETVLFGTGVEEMADDLDAIVERHGVTAVVVEHGDRDHYEGAPGLAARHDLPIAIPAGDAHRLREAGVDPDVEFAVGEPVWGIETIPAPGHTPDNASYRHGDVVIAGDTVVGADSGFAEEGDWSGPLAMVLASYSEDDAQARASVSNLLEPDFETLLVTHGSNVLEGGRDAVETLVSDLEAQE